jgi:hypothetical protein
LMRGFHRMVYITPIQWGQEARERGRWYKSMLRW